MKLAGRGIVVTGASRGLGRAIMLACLDEGAHVLLCGRDADALEATRCDAVERAPSGQVVSAVVADVARVEDVESIVARARRDLPGVHGLVNNAGVYGPLGLLEDLDWNEWEHAVRVNLFGTVLMCRALVPVFRSGGYGKIVNLSGGGATSALPRFSAYAASKAAVVRFTETLAGETAGAAIDVNAVAPGALDTRLLDQVLEAGPERVGAEFYERAQRQKTGSAVPLEAGAALCVFLLAGESDGITGRLLSAIWDPWRNLPDHIDELATSDVYTLRRITPADRGMADWESG